MKMRRVLLTLALLLVLVAVAGLCIGSVRLSLAQITSALMGKGDESANIILWQIRLPRVLAGILAGIGLSVSGVLLQNVTSNELASPNVIGINSGAGLAVILLLTFVPHISALLPVVAFVGAFGVALVILLASNRFGSSKTIILLVGIAVTTVLNAFISLLSLLDDGVLSQYNYFTVGSLKAVSLSELVVPAFVVAIAFFVAVIMSGKLNVLCMGDELAQSLGVRVKIVRIVCLICASASAASVVSFAGLLGFVGLVVPHIAKTIVGQNPKKVLPVSAFLGAIVVTLADMLGRTLFAPSEIPVGILMSLVGAPYFLILLCRRKKYADI